MDPALSLPDHNSGKAACKGGPSCASLCAGTSFYQKMKATMLQFWRTTRLSAVDQDGSRYMPCSNASHAHHHGFNDSMRVQFDEIKSLFRSYLAGGKSKQTPLATKNLLEDTDGSRRPPLEGGATRSISGLF